MLRRLHPVQPDSFAFTAANLAWAQGQISKYPEGRQASAIIPLLWRAQEQEGWLSRKAIETVADMLGMAYIRALEVATFYFMFQLQPVGSVAHVQICGTTSCMICGAEELIAVCKEMIAKTPHTLSLDGKFSWEEVECLGACANAPMAQIGKDYYEDLTAEKLRDMIARFSKGEVPTPGPQNGRYAAEPLSGLTTLKDFESGRQQYNASAQRAVDLRDTVKRIDGTEVPILTPWLGKAAKTAAKVAVGAAVAAVAVAAVDAVTKPKRTAKKADAADGTEAVAKAPRATKKKTEGDA
ncbi:NADH-quinone oxidoreductase subunit NuoE [Gemmobacter aquarius]|uniref:NADH-quinone oxidoreductase subunit NuoE n=1 Tax=Paragemmobacter aquarius TaxID=2169400 RepID=A0A2S0UJU1_9RHOB|nr:NADH-quinone oxidoreductase subunit NuoE [Gemmobacter aquarius]